MEVSYIAAFIGGLLTFFAPCTLPLLPAFLGFNAGVGSRSRRTIVMRAIGFISGFLAVFVTLGLFAGGFGSFIALHREALVRGGGLVVMLFALVLLGTIKIPYLAERHGPTSMSKRAIGHPLFAFVIGLSFSLGWTPCLGPILGSILVLAGAAGHALSGALLLFTYGLGIAIPFLLFALGIGEVTLLTERSLSLMRSVSVVGGIFLFAMGLAMLLGYWPIITGALSGLISPLHLTWVLPLV